MTFKKIPKYHLSKSTRFAIDKLSKFTNHSKTVMLIPQWPLLPKTTHTHTCISCHLNLNQWRLISLRETESNGIRKGRNSAYLCWDLGTCHLAGKMWPYLSALLSWSSAGRMWVSSHTWNLIPSNPMIIISGQQEGHLHDPKHTWPDLNGLLCTTVQVPLSFLLLCLPSGQRSP